MKVLMVCLGNICRSPMAQAILEQKIKERNLDWVVDSAGTGGWHVGESADKRAIAEAKRNGIDISNQRARKFIDSDFTDFDLILVMDTDNYNDVRSLTQNEDHKNKVKFITDYLYPNRNVAVPDPYYNGRFAESYELLDLAIDRMMEKMQN